MRVSLPKGLRHRRQIAVVRRSCASADCTLPGVESAGVIDDLPVLGGSVQPIVLEGQPELLPRDQPTVGVRKSRIHAPVRVGRHRDCHAHRTIAAIDLVRGVSRDPRDRSGTANRRNQDDGGGRQWDADIAAIQRDVLGIFAAVALVLASVGIYSVLSYIVRGRQREIAVRTALGACTVDVLRMVIIEGMIPALTGIAVGAAGAFAAGAVLSKLAFG